MKYLRKLFSQRRSKNTTRFHVFAFSGNALMTKMYFGMVHGSAEDKEFQFFKSHTLFMSYINQPAETLNGDTVNISTLHGDWLLVIPVDVLPHLQQSKLWEKCHPVTGVNVGTMDPALVNVMIKFIHENWGQLYS